MKYKILTSAILIIIFTNLAGASISELDPVQSGECIKIYQTCGNCTFSNVTSVLLPNDTEDYLNKAMDKRGVNYNYSYCNTEEKGTYTINGVSDVDGVNTVWAYNVVVKYSGTDLDVGQSIIQIAFTALLIFVLFGTFFMMGFLPSSNARNPQGQIISLSYLKYLRLVLWMFAYSIVIAIFYITSNIAFAYLPDSLIAETFFALFVLSLALLPVVIILIVVSFFVRFHSDRDIQRMINRGIYPDSI